jgi:hypothetical protein
MVALKPASMHSLKTPSLTAQITTQCVSEAFFAPQKGARYLNPQTGLWLSTDPAMGEYVPQAPINDDVRKQNGNLPGMGGVFNVVNLHVYHYAGNNPVKYTDPDGNAIDTPWDIANGILGVICGTLSLYLDDTWGAVLSYSGAALDFAAAALPFIPGGASTAIQSVKAAQVGLSGISILHNLAKGIADRDPIQIGVAIVQIIGVTLGLKGDKYLKFAEDAYKRATLIPRSMIYGMIASGIQDEHIGAFFKAMSMLGVNADNINSSIEEYKNWAKNNTVN